MKRIAICCFLFAGSLFGQAIADNPKLTELFNVDQSAREGKNIDWSKLSVEDLQRRQQVHQMLDAGEVRTGTDYLHAAMVFQHGLSPDDYLLAHVLAVAAISLGSKEARWLSAATLDRYLRSIWQPQVYGTQFATRPGDAMTQMTQQMMNPALVSDSMRATVCVVSTAEQQKTLQSVRHSGKLQSTQIKECR